MCRRLAADCHVTGGWSIGAVALVAAWLARTHADDTRIVAVFPDGPQRYADTVFNDAYCRHHDLLNHPPAADPDLVDHPGERDVTRWTRCTRVQDPTADVRPEAAR